jgi:hypothetical protein
MGRITIENDMAQFSCKLEADPDLWDTKKQIASEQLKP